MRRSATFLIALLLAAAAIQVAQGRLYRWVDDEGNVHYSDSIPPQQIGDSHDMLREDGVKIKSVPRVKTAEELEKERELERLRGQQERLLEQERAKDEALLRSFRSEDDIVMARDGKIAAIDVKVDVVRNNIRRRQEKLAGLLKKAANRERAGKSIPDHLEQSIAQVEREIGDAYGSILDGERQKDEIRATFQKDLERFRRIKNITTSHIAVTENRERPLLHNIVSCAGAQECSRLWAKATDYVRKHATTPIQTSTEAVFITARPVNEGEIGLILSRVDAKKGQGASLFLDLQCKESLRGNMMCRDQRAQGIIKGFRPALVGKEGA